MNKIEIPGYVHQYPAPAVLIGTGSIEKPNLITCSWFGTVNSEPPMVSVSIRPGRFSYPNVMATEEFTVNIPSVQHLNIVKHCGSHSGRDHNKFEKLNLTPADCAPLQSAPMIKEFPLVLACKVKENIELGTHTLFIAEIVAIHSSEENVRPSGRVDPKSKEQLVYLDGRYWRLTPAE